MKKMLLIAGVAMFAGLLGMNGVCAVDISDNDWIDNAIKNRKNGIVVIPRRNLSTESERDWWLIDRAILVPGDTTIVLQNCKIKLSDKCRDNFFRSANCGLGITDIKPLKNIEIRGEGFAVLEGADHPRSTGDSSKIMAVPCPKRMDLPNWDMHAHSYGTDVNKKGEHQKGDWRNIGILMANVDGLRIENLRIVESHSWAISLEACTRARLSRLDFSSRQMRVIDGLESNIENQDGIDLRNGCSDVIISDVTGHTGDDVIALTAIVNPNKKLPGGEVGSMHVMHSDYSKRDKEIKNVIINNVNAYPSTGTAIVRLLACESKIHKVSINNVVDCSPENHHSRASILLGEPDTSYGRCLPGSITDLTINNLISNGYVAISVLGYVSHGAFCNIVNRNPVLRKWKGLEVIKVEREGGLENVKISNIAEPREYPAKNQAKAK